MWIHLILPILVCLNTVISRDVGKTLSMKTIPYITNSLVNLGKMDISFHFNTHPQDLPSSSVSRSHGSNSFFATKSESPEVDHCPCSSVTYLKDSSQNYPTDLLNRILSGNDLFSFKEPTSSASCCDSHEQVREDILLEFGPKQSQTLNSQSSNSNQFSLLPFLLETFKHKPTMPTVSARPNAVEILFFPKKRGILPVDFEKLAAKKKDIKMDTIKVVGDKEMKNDFKSLNLMPPLPSSVKKDLALQETKKTETKDVHEIATDRHLNTVV